MNPVLLALSRFTDGIPVATDTDPNGDFDVLNIADLRPAKKHKFNGAGTKYYTVDCGADKTASMLGFRTHNLKTANASVSVEKTASFTLSDAFDDSSFDTTNFGSGVDGVGTVTETTHLALVAPGMLDAAFAWDRNAQPNRIFPWDVKIKLDATPVAARTLYLLSMTQKSSEPEVDDIGQNRVRMYMDDAGDITISYKDTGGILHYWNTGTGLWQLGVVVAFAGSVGTTYVARMINDSTDLTIQLWNSTETVKHVEAVIAIASIQDDGFDDYFSWGDPFVPLPVAGSMNVYLYEHTTVGLSWAEVLAPFTPTSDRAFLKSFTQATSRFWRVKMVTSSVAVYAGVVLLGDPLIFPKPPDAPFDPYQIKTVGWTNTSQLGEPIGSGVRMKTRKVKMKFARLSRSWVMGTFKPLYDSHLSKLKPVLFCWNLDDTYADVLFAWLPKKYSFTAALRVMENVAKFRVDIESVEERV